jgi:hypothetical protein
MTPYPAPISASTWIDRTLRFGAGLAAVAAFAASWATAGEGNWKPLQATQVTLPQVVVVARRDEPAAAAGDAVERCQVASAGIDGNLQP